MTLDFSRRAAWAFVLSFLVEVTVRTSKARTETPIIARGITRIRAARTGFDVIEGAIGISVQRVQLGRAGCGKVARRVDDTCKCGR